ncbi:MAG: fatty acid desaturase [Gammaproteobacteria bacterium]|nr:fatty acid desaturase [Gammaproteobacteria bacterium]
MDPIQKNKTQKFSDNLTEYSWDEISKHNNNDDCWIVIDQFVYDVTPWVKHHPGGNVLTILAGEDATAMYYSNHFNTSEKILGEFLIGSVKKHEPLFSSYEDQFFSTLKQRVSRYYKDNNINYRETNKTYRQLLITSLVFFSCWLTMYFFPPWGLLAAIPMGLATSSLIGYFGHEFIHGNIFTRLSQRRGYWVLNNILWGIFIPFMPEKYFQYEHIRHHNYPMHPDHDYDVFALKDFVRLSPAITKKRHHDFQHMYAPFTYGVYIFLQLLGGYTTSFFEKREILKDKGSLRDIIFSSLVAVSFHFILPVYLANAWWVLLGAGLYFFSWQSAIYISSGLPHMTELSKNENKTNSWSYHVCNSTKNLKAGNKFFNWLTGGLNCHLNHHLLPSVPQEHLHAVTPIIEQTCKEFGYPYTNYTSFKSYYSDHFQFLKTLGPLDKVKQA